MKVIFHYKSDIYGQKEILDMNGFDAGQSSMLMESAVDRYIDNLIGENLPSALKPYSDKTVGELCKTNETLMRMFVANPQDRGEFLDKYGNTKVKDYLRISIQQMFGINRNKGPKKYLRGIFRILIKELQYLKNPNENMDKLNELKQYVTYVAATAEEGDPETATLDGDLGGMTLKGLGSKFGKKCKTFFKDKYEKAKGLFSGKRGVSDYEKVVITSHDQCFPFSQYTSWCITHNDNNYDTYVEGGNRFYIFLKRGYQSVPEEVGDGCPLDAYGLSMISVLVDMYGNITLLTTRWNHQHDGEFRDPDEETMGKFIKATGIDFYKECPPYSEKDRHRLGLLTFDDAAEMLANGADPKSVFNEVGNFYNGLARVKLNGKYNFINKQHEFLSEDWFDDVVDDFYKGIPAVKLNGKWNFINTEGNVVFKQWLDRVEYFHNGMMAVKLNDKWNVINTDGDVVSKQWFDYVDDFHKGIATVKLNGKYNFINTDGDVVFKQWFNFVDDFHNGMAAVKLNDKWNFINTEGNIISDQWFGGESNFREGLAAVWLRGKGWNFINTDGDVVSKQWFNFVNDFHKGFAKVGLNGKYYYIDTKGNFYDLDKQRIPSPLGESFYGSPYDIEILGKNNFFRLDEAKISIDDKYRVDVVKKNKNISIEDYRRLCRLDPTTIIEKNMAGKYCSWMINKIDVQRLNDQEYLDAIRVALEQYNDGKKRNLLDAMNILKDINSFKTMDDFLDAMGGIMDFNTNGMTGADMRKLDNLQGQYEIVRESANWYVVKPLTWEAERYFGSNTKWCTVGAENYFKNYTNSGPLFITMPKDKSIMDKRMQFHFESGSFADVDDNVKHDPISCISSVVGVGKSLKELINLWRDIRFGFDERYFRDGFVKVGLKGKFNFINTDGDVVFKQWFNFVDDFYNGLARVELNGKWNFINTDGDVVSDRWFDNVGYFREGLADVKLNDKWNVINTDGDVVFKQWFDNVGYFREGIATVKLNGKYNFINTDGDVVFKQWFDNVGYFREGFAHVELNGKWNFINTDGDVVSDRWFDNIDAFREGLAAVKLNDKYNFINTDGDVVFKQWFDNVTCFNDGFAKVQLKNKWYYIDTKGNFYDLDKQRIPSPLGESLGYRKTKFGITLI